MNQKDLVGLIIDDLDKTRIKLLQLVKQLPDNAFEKRFDNKWNAPEILGHLHRFEEMVSDFFQNYISSKTQRAGIEYTGKRLSKAWFDSLNNDNVKYNAPDVMLSTRLTRDEYQDAFMKSNKKLKKVIDDAMNYAFDKIIIPHPNGVKLNLIEWLELMSVHEKRHIRQLEHLLF